MLLLVLPALLLLLPVVLAKGCSLGRPGPFLTAGATDPGSPKLDPGGPGELLVLGGVPLTLTPAMLLTGLLLLLPLLLGGLLLLPLLLLLLLPPLLLPRVLALPPLLLLLLPSTKGHGASLDGGFSLSWSGSSWTTSGHAFCRTCNASRQASFSPCHTSPGPFLDQLPRSSLRHEKEAVSQSATHGLGGAVITRTHEMWHPHTCHKIIFIMQGARQ